MTPVSHGKPCAGNPHARFEEGTSAPEKPRRKALHHKKIIFVCWLAVTMPLLALVAYEAYYLFGMHLQAIGYSREYQRMLYSKISATARALNGHMSAEDLLQKFDADNPRYLSKEMVEEMPPWEKGRYKGFVNESYLALDWKIYDIEPILDYRGSLEIGSFEGEVQDVRLVYTLDMEE